MSKKWLVSFPLAEATTVIRNDGESLRDYAKRLVQNKEYEYARFVYLQLLDEAGGSDAGLLTNLSLMESKLGHWQMSARFAEQATRMENNVKAWYRLGVALSKIGAKDRAESCCARACEVEGANAAVLALRGIVNALPPPGPTHEIYGALINIDSSASVLPESLWARIMGLCAESDVPALRLTCTLFQYISWHRLSARSVSVHAARPWRLAHRMPHLEKLTVVLRQGQIESDWKSVCETTFGGRSVATLFPSLSLLHISPSIAGLNRKELKSIISKLDRDSFENEEELECYISCPADVRLDMTMLGRVSPKLTLHMHSLLPPSTIPVNLHGLCVSGNLQRCSSDDFRVLVRSNLFVLKVKATPSSEVSFGHDLSGSCIDNKMCQYLPATLERLVLKELPSFVFPIEKLPQGLKHLSVSGLYWKDAHLKGLPPLLETLKLDFTISDETTLFSFQTFSLVGLPKRATRCTVKKPAKKNWKMGRFELDARCVAPTTELIVKE
jgi:hypothetical protein